MQRRANQVWIHGFYKFQLAGHTMQFPPQQSMPSTRSWEPVHRRGLRKRHRILPQGCPRLEDSPGAVPQRYHAVGAGALHHGTSGSTARRQRLPSINDVGGLPLLVAFQLAAITISCSLVTAWICNLFK
jgi:hypothetical protein